MWKLKRNTAHIVREMLRLKGLKEDSKLVIDVGKTKQNYYRRNPEKYAEYKKQFRENCPEQYKEQCRRQMKAYMEKVTDVMITCPVCNYSIKKYKKSQHEQSKFHQDSLRRQEHLEEYEEENKPDERVVLDDLEYDYCYCCNFHVRPWEWRWHIEEEKTQTKQNETYTTIDDIQFYLNNISSSFLST